MKLGMMTSGDMSLAKISERLRVTREALGYSQASYCRKVGLSKPAYNQNEKGKTRPSLDNALRICHAFSDHRITLEWIFRGDGSGLNPALHEAIKAIRQTRG